MRYIILGILALLFLACSDTGSAADEGDVGTRLRGRPDVDPTPGRSPLPEERDGSNAWLLPDASTPGEPPSDGGDDGDGSDALVDPPPDDRRPICDPDDPVFCRDGNRLRCDDTGYGWEPFPCELGEVCVEQRCVGIQANVIVLVDTSTSMNAVVEHGVYPEQCAGNGCPTWTFPACEDPLEPATRIGRVKRALGEVFDSALGRSVRIALQRFPQEGSDDPDCDGGYNRGRRTVDGDRGERSIPPEGWFTENLSSVVAVPFTADPANQFERLSAWIDFEEAARGTGQRCVNSWDCPSNICEADECLEVTNPELRGSGFTPIGRSLFYSGEYLRHHVLVEGKACAIDDDCGSPHHGCVEGLCHDPLGSCRPNVIVLFTDGGETDSVDLDDFFHPRVQAKRLHYGLGCAGDADCLGGASCDPGGICRPPAGTVDPAALICTVFGIPCETAGDCIDPCALAPCNPQCRPTSVDTTGGGDPFEHLTDWAGNPVSVTVHVVDASGVERGNQDIALYGGGRHMSVDLLDVDELVGQVTLLLDTKTLVARCPELLGEP